MTTLISFLGKAQPRSTASHEAVRYRKAKYRFDDGVIDETEFFGSALMRRLRPERTLLLGTAGSMWNALDLDADAAGWVEFEQACEQGQVDQPMLDRIQGQARQAMMGAQLVLIPYADTTATQIELLELLARHVRPGESLVIDVTHGFRHLPMLALVASRHLARVRDARVEDIYYGALEMSRDALTPVVKLEGLLRMLDWVEALAAHDASGSYDVFASLLQADGLSTASARSLAEAAHLERLTNVSDAKAKLSPIVKEIAGLGGATKLFSEQLTQRLAWAREPTEQARKFALAEIYLKRQDFLRSAVYLQEAAIDAVCDSQRLIRTNHGDREQARGWLRTNGNSAAFVELGHLRNLFAHGTAGDDAAYHVRATRRTAQTRADLTLRLGQLAMSIRSDLDRIL